MPHNVHQALVPPLVFSMYQAFQSILLSRGDHSIILQVNSNTSVDGENISTIPDICIWISSWRSALQLAAMHKYIFVEMGFLQLKPQVMHKLKEYTRSHSHTLMVMKIMIRESGFSSPSNLSCPAAKYAGTDVLRNEEWRPEPTHLNTFKVICDGFTWIDITSIDITI
ncbi:hypothetical protein JVT61DRAFT_54 [Boletus reticuloceps]|uniref:Uncharacterized protein n=1 Tax=Boletus reticuloceps TaxID=495285 RepID=A0A8I2YZ60_9AGAM|nr:hypothetical protein JVT61DRAFT_54 [Boletus reticuloceps]